MQSSTLKIAVFGSTPLPEVADIETPFHGRLLAELCRLSHRVSIFKPAAFEWQRLRLVDTPPYEGIGFYQPHSRRHLLRQLGEAGDADVLVSLGGIDRFDETFERILLAQRSEDRVVVRWDLDAPQTLDLLFDQADHPMRRLLPEYDLVLAEGGGDRVAPAYRSLGAARCERLLHGVLPGGRANHALSDDQTYCADVSLVCPRVAEAEDLVDEFLLRPASRRPNRRFILGGPGWDDHELPGNVRYIGAVHASDVDAVMRSPLTVLALNTESLRGYGFSPSPGLLDAAAAGACVVTDDWRGIEEYLEPQREVLVARDGDEIVQILDWLTPARARCIGSAARRRILGEHTVTNRARKVAHLLTGLRSRRELSVAETAPSGLA